MPQDASKVLQDATKMPPRCSQDASRDQWGTRKTIEKTLKNDGIYNMLSIWLQDGDKMHPRCPSKPICFHVDLSQTSKTFKNNGFSKNFKWLSLTSLNASKIAPRCIQEPSRGPQGTSTSTLKPPEQLPGPERT